jgi:NTP pyrophosphatase (non-canonical NTP hydrolase)
VSGLFSIGSDVWPGLSKLVEESGEVTQVIGKIIGAYPNVDHWDGTNLRERLQDELGDLSAAIVFVKRYCGLSEDAVERRAAYKLAMFERWHVEQGLAALIEGAANVID